jgi:hypothetical protein
VLREGIDCPWLSHGIFATIFGSLQSYLQAGGRLLRASANVPWVTVQDHGGNWWRHGSLNADRIWKLSWTGAMYAGEREEDLREKKEPEPFRCPKCAKIVRSRRCECGWESKTWALTRPVVQTNGDLVEMAGDIFRVRRIYKKPSGPAKWKRMYFRARSRKWNATFRQAAAMFAKENYWCWPDPTWPFMPVNRYDVYRLVADVPPEKLIQEPPR